MATGQGQLGPGNRDGTTATGQLRQYRRDITARQDNEDGIAEAGQSGRIGLSAHPGKHREDRLARTWHQGQYCAKIFGKPTFSQPFEMSPKTRIVARQNLANFRKFREIFAFCENQNIRFVSTLHFIRELKTVVMSINSA
jgi:hypothetical protein